jgi:hypothetical protein
MSSHQRGRRLERGHRITRRCRRTDASVAALPRAPAAERQYCYAEPDVARRRWRAMTYLRRARSAPRLLREVSRGQETSQPVERSDREVGFVGWLI